MTKQLDHEQVEHALTFIPHHHCTKCIGITKRYAPTIAGDVLRSLTRTPRTAREIGADIGRSAKQVRSRMRAFGIARVGGRYSMVEGAL